MNINIPQYISVRRNEDRAGEYDHTAYDVLIGDVTVYTHWVYDGGYYEEGEEEMEAVSAFGRMLALKIGDSNV